MTFKYSNRLVTNLNFYGKLNRALNYATIAKNYFEGSGKLAMLKLKEVVSSILSFVSKMVPVDSHLLLFETGLDKADDNPRAVYDYLLKNNPYNFKHKFVVTKETDITGIDPNDIVYRRTVKFYWFMMRSKVWVRAQSLGALVKKKNNQIYLQLWHGTELKKECYNIHDTPIEERIQKSHTKEWDLFVATNERDVELFKTSVGWFDGEFEVLGLPRYDNLFSKNTVDSNEKKNILKKYRIPTTYKKYILYAPTYRDWEMNQGNDVVSIGLNDVISVIPKDYALLIRLHPLLLEQSKSLTFPENCFPVTHVNKISDLFFIADTLITDYSSVVYDYMLVSKSIIWYLYDKERYFNERGGVYYDYETELPGYVCDKIEELKKAIDSLDSFEMRALMDKKHKASMEIIHKYTDGNASSRVVELIASKTGVKSE